MEPVIIVTVLALLQFMIFGARSGGARGKAGLSAPATTGDDVYERTFRVHQNTMELLVLLLPAMWMFGYYVNALMAAGLGMIYIIARIFYSASYIRDPNARSPAFTASIMPIALMLVWTLVDAILAYF